MNENQEQGQDPQEKPLKAAARIMLPQWIAASCLSLSEIGAMVCVSCAETQAEGRPRALQRRLLSADVRNAFNGLRKKGVMTVTKHDGRKRVSFDVNVVRPD